MIKSNLINSIGLTTTVFFAVWWVIHDGFILGFIHALCAGMYLGFLINDNKSK